MFGKTTGTIMAVMLAMAMVETASADPVDPPVDPDSCVPNFSYAQINTPLLDYAPNFVRPNKAKQEDYLFKAYLVNPENLAGALEVVAFFMCVAEPIKRAQACYDEYGTDVDAFIACLQELE